MEVFGGFIGIWVFVRVVRSVLGTEVRGLCMSILRAEFGLLSLRPAKEQERFFHLRCMHVQTSYLHYCSPPRWSRPKRRVALRIAELHIIMCCILESITRSCVEVIEAC
jgi:hypothetical protein